MSNAKKVGLWLLYYIVIFAVMMGLVLIPDWLDGGALTVEGDRIDDLFMALIYLSVVITAVVMATVMFSLIHFRAGKGDDRDGAVIHGNNKLEVTWTIIPFIIVIVITIVSYDVLVKNENEVTEFGSDKVSLDVSALDHPELPTGTEIVQVVGYQFGWDYTYPELNAATTTNFVVPDTRPIIFQVTSKKFVAKQDGTVQPDVIHSFWVPASRIKQDAVPGIVTDIQWTAKPGNTGSYPVYCAELCGALHSQMVGEVCVVSESDYDDWFADLRSAVGSDDTGEVDYPCGSADDGTDKIGYRVWSDTDHEEQLGLTEDAALSYAGMKASKVIGEHSGDDHDGDKDHGGDKSHDGDKDHNNDDDDADDDADADEGDADDEDGEE